MKTTTVKCLRRLIGGGGIKWIQWSELIGSQTSFRLNECVNLIQQKYILEVKWRNINVKRSQWMNVVLKLQGESHIVSLVWAVQLLLINFIHQQQLFHSVWFLQRVRIARNADRCNSHTISVCPSVCLSDRHVSVFRLDKWRYDRAVSASGSTILLVFGQEKFIRIFARDHPSEDVKVKHLLSLAKNWPIIGHNLETMQDRG